VTAPRVPAMAMDPELKKKLLFTLLALVLYRIGAHIAAPGVNVQALSDFIKNSAAAGFFGLYDMLGGGLSRATVFALGIMPFISSSIIFQLAGGVVPSVGKMQKDEEGRKKLTQWTRYTTVVIALSQSYTYALFTESIPGAVASPGLASRLVMVIILTTGAIFVMWLGEQITENGIGNGASYRRDRVPGGRHGLRGSVARRHRCRDGHDHRGASHPDPDSSKGHGTRTYPGRA